MTTARCPRLSDPDVGPELHLPGGVRAVVHVGASKSAGTFTLISDVAPPGWALPPHRHDVSETIYVSAGSMWVDIDGRRATIETGNSVHVPAGVRHAGGTAGHVSVERVLVFAPGGMERLFEALTTVSEPAEMLRLAHDHGWRFD